MLDGFGVRNACKLLRRNSSQALAEIVLGDILLEEFEILIAVLENVIDAVLQVGFGAIHVVVQVGKRHLGLNHPELSQMARGVAIFSTEGRAKSIYIVHSTSHDFTVQLP